jgi:hypothetical protein
MVVALGFALVSPLVFADAGPEAPANVAAAADVVGEAGKVAASTVDPGSTVGNIIRAFKDAKWLVLTGNLIILLAWGIRKIPLDFLKSRIGGYIVATLATAATVIGLPLAAGAAFEWGMLLTLALGVLATGKVHDLATKK